MSQLGTFDYFSQVFFIIAEKKDRFGNAQKINSKSLFPQNQKSFDFKIQLS